MASCLKRRSAPTCSAGVCNHRTTVIAFLTLAMGFTFLIVRICSFKETRKPPFETSLHRLQSEQSAAGQNAIQSKSQLMNATELRPREINQPSIAFFETTVAASSSSGDNKRPVLEIVPLDEHSSLTSKADPIPHRDEPPRRWQRTVDGESSDNHMRHVLLLQAVPDLTHESEQSTSIGSNKRLCHLLNGLKRRIKVISLFQRRKLNLDNLSESRQARLTSEKINRLDRPSFPKDTKITRPANGASKSRLCCLLCQETSMPMTNRTHRRRRSATEEDLQKLKKFLIRLLEATMSAEERTARNLTDLFLDGLLKEETEFRLQADDRNTSTGINNNTESQRKEHLIASNAVVGKGNITGIGEINGTKENITRLEQNKENTTASYASRNGSIAGKSEIAETGARNQSGKAGKTVAEVAESRLEAEVAKSRLGGEGFGNVSLGGIGAVQDGKLIISAQITNGSKSKEIAQIVVDSKHGMEVDISMTNASGNASTEPKQWIVELSGEQKMFVAAVIAIASIVAVGTLVFACVWCLYDQEGLCMGVFPCIRPPKDNFSPQRWWMETLARRVENLESQPFLVTEKNKRRGTSQSYQMNKEGRLSQMVSRLSESMSNGSQSMTKKEEMARASQMDKEGRLSQMVSRLSSRMSRNSGQNMTKKEQMVRASQLARASQMARVSSQVATENQIHRDSQAGNATQMARDSKMVGKSSQLSRESNK